MKKLSVVLGLVLSVISYAKAHDKYECDLNELKKSTVSSIETVRAFDLDFSEERKFEYFMKPEQLVIKLQGNKIKISKKVEGKIIAKQTEDLGVESFNFISMEEVSHQIRLSCTRSQDNQIFSESRVRGKEVYDKYFDQKDIRHPGVIRY